MNRSLGTTGGIAERRPRALARLRGELRAGAREREVQLQFVRFAVVGASGYLVNLGVYALAIGPGGFGPFAAAALAFVVSVANNFTWNRLWTFRAAAAGGRPSRQAPRFLAVSLVGLGVNLAVLGLMLDVAGLGELPAQAIAVGAALPVNFLGNRLWTFATGVRRDGTPLAGG